MNQPFMAVGSRCLSEVDTVALNVSNGSGLAGDRRKFNTAR